MYTASAFDVGYNRYVTDSPVATVISTKRRTQTYRHTHPYMHTPMHTHTHAHTPPCTHTFIHICLFIYKYIYTRPLLFEYTTFLTHAVLNTHTPNTRKATQTLSRTRTHPLTHTQMPTLTTISVCLYIKNASRHIR